MKKALFFASIVVVLLVTLPLLAACSTDTIPTTPTTTATPLGTTTPSTSPVQGLDNWWDEFGEPEYGKEMVIGTTGITTPGGFDPYGKIPGLQYVLSYESMMFFDWTTNPEEWAPSVGFAPAEYRAGLLAESWEIPDASTIIVHLRDDVYWQDKSPVNGRKFTAYDVKYHYDRFTGKGEFSGSEPSAVLGPAIAIDEVTVTDDYTIKFKFNVSSISNFYLLADFHGRNVIESRESVDLGIQDWENVVGTGPYILTDFIDDSSMKYEENPNYWAYDERHPQNKLPYLDSITFSVIKDMATSVAALRSGRIDYLCGLSWQQKDSLQSSNPEIQMFKVPMVGFSLVMNCSKPPFNDIRVRKALQMSVDREAIAASYYSGEVDATPVGLVTGLFKGFNFDYNDWPQQLKDEYAYNPTKAQELLKDAGYPSGFGVSVVTLNAGTRSDLQLLQVIQSNLSEIGVDIEIAPMDTPTFMAYCGEGKHEAAFVDDCGLVFGPDTILQKRESGGAGNYAFSSDQNYDEIVNNLRNSKTNDEYQQYSQSADRYALEQHWAVNIVPQAGYNAATPNIRGYSGQIMGNTGAWGQGFYLARLWKGQ